VTADFFPANHALQWWNILIAKPFSCGYLYKRHQVSEMSKATIITAIATIAMIAVFVTPLSARTYEQYGLEPAAFIINDHSQATFNRVRDVLGTLDAKGLCLFPPDAVFGYVPISFDPNALQGLPVDMIRDRGELSGTALGAEKRGIVAALLDGEGEYSHRSHHRADSRPEDAVLYVPAEIVERTKADGPRQGSALDLIGRNIQQNSEFLLGSVLVNVIFPESQAGSESWTNDEIAEVMQFVARGCDEFMQHALWTDLSFTFDYQDYRRVPVTNEPIELEMAMDEFWIG
jgi:hypothetical protein